MKGDKIWLARSVIEEFANIPAYSDIENYFSTAEHIRVSPLMIKTLIEHFLKAQPHFTNVHTTFWDGLYYENDGLKKFIDVDNTRGQSDAFWYEHFCEKFKNPSVDCGSVRIAVKLINYDAFWLCSSPVTDNQPICQHTIMSDFIIARILGASKAFTNIYLKAIAAQTKIGSDNNGKLKDFDSTMKSMTAEQKSSFDVLLRNGHYSHYNSTEELLGEFRNCFNEPKFDNLYPYLSKLTPLHLCVAQTVGSLCIGLLTGQNKEVRLGALTVINIVCCAIMYNVYRKSNNFTKFTKTSLQSFKTVISEDNEILPYTFMMQAVVSATNLSISGISGYRLSSIFNLAVVATSACRVLQLQAHKEDVFTFGLNQ